GAETLQSGTSIANNLTVGGTVSASTAEPLTIGGALSVANGSSFITDATDAFGVTGNTSNSGTLTLGNSMTGSGTLTNNATGVLNIGSILSGPTLNASTAGNTVNYTGAAQTI